MATPKELLDDLLKDVKHPEDLLGKNGLLKQLTKDLVERVLEEELTDYLGYEKHAVEGRGTGNSRNGKSEKTLQGEQGQIPLNIPRDRNGEFEPRLITKGQRRLPGLDDKIISMYARGMTYQEIQGHLQEMYGVRVVTGSALVDYRCGDGRGDRLAISTAGQRLSGDLSRCAVD